MAKKIPMKILMIRFRIMQKMIQIPILNTTKMMKIMKIMKMLFNQKLFMLDCSKW